MEIVLELLKLAGVGLVAGLFSSWLSNRDYRLRKWWELRASAYQVAIEALSDLVYYYETHYNAAIKYTELSEDFKKQLSGFWQEAFPRVRKAADSGAFLFSDEANAALKDFTKERGDIDFWVDHLDDRLSRARTSLGRLVECSKKDLKLKAGFLEWFS